MQFTSVFALAAAIVGVSANVHSACHCVDTVSNQIDQDVTKQACTNYPRAKLYTAAWPADKLITDPSTVTLSVNVDGVCESRDAATGKLAAHLGGDQFLTACTRNAPDGVDVTSLCA